MCIRDSIYGLLSVFSSYPTFYWHSNYLIQRENPVKEVLSKRKRSRETKCKIDGHKICKLQLDNKFRWGIIYHNLSPNLSNFIRGRTFIYHFLLELINLHGIQKILCIIFSQFYFIHKEKDEYQTSNHFGDDDLFHHSRMRSVQVPAEQCFKRFTGHS